MSLLLLLTGCQWLPRETTPASPWWQDTVFYEIFVRSFYDSNGDGIGDLNGLTQKLDYLKDLGVSGVWLMPVFPSPSYHGYDVTDYYSINPQYGSMDDFKNMLAEAHKRGIRVILDLPLNHTSNQHPWFVDANGSPHSAHRDWYLWSDTNPGYLNPSGGPAWTPGRTGFYYSIFSPQMPDLNYRNPQVTAEMEKVVHFWLTEVGIDGFRFDAAKHLIEEGQKQENTASTHAWYKDFFKVYKADKPDAFIIGEAFNADAFLASTYTGDQLDMMFDFELASGFVNSANGGASSAVVSALSFARESLPGWQFGSFLTNHDQSRVMSMLNGDTGKARVAASLLLTSPGVPFLYYGEEIGMTGEKPDPQIRTPMLWAEGPTSGFTTGTPWEKSSTGGLNNVADESADPASLLSHYRKLIALRNTHSALRGGALALVTSANPGVYAALRYDPGQAILVVINLTGKPVSAYSLALAETAALADGKHNLTDLYGGAAAAVLNVSGGKFSSFEPIKTLDPYGTYILQLQP